MGIQRINMRYWGYLIAKLTVAAAILLILRKAVA
jgi:hypothetical protein